MQEFLKSGFGWQICDVNATIEPLQLKEAREFLHNNVKNHVKCISAETIQKNKK
jgi:hypothetical protein